MAPYYSVIWLSQRIAKIQIIVFDKYNIYYYWVFPKCKLTCITFLHGIQMKWNWSFREIKLIYSIHTSLHNQKVAVETQTQVCPFPEPSALLSLQAGRDDLREHIWMEKMNINKNSFLKGSNQQKQ